MGRVSAHVSPGAPRTELVGRHGDGWKVRVAAPPERGRANTALVDFLTELMGLPRGRVSVVSGHKGRRKVVEVVGVDAAEIERRLRRALGPASEGPAR
jgi:uncharacterized protein